jgi:2-methylisocitrate lyase-like PEP mutase family enzyme
MRALSMALDGPAVLCHGSARGGKVTAPTTIGRLLADAPLVLPGVWDALSARLAARAGCRAVFVSGYALSATRLGAGDLGLVTQTEMLDAAARVCAAVEVPVIADADTGYGGERNVARTVRELVRAGAAGCFLEDQMWPKRCGHLEGKRVVSLDEYLAKLRAALRARGDAPFHVTARTDARAVHGLDDALVRARAFADAGADAVFVEAPETEDEMARIRAAVPADVPLVANMVEGGRTPLRSASALARAGYHIIVRPLTALFAATHAVRDAYEALRDEDRAADSPSFAFAEMNDVLGVGHLTRASRS